MKKLLNILLAVVLTGLFYTSCHEEPLEKEHIEIWVYVDSIVYNEATYIENNNSVVYYNGIIDSLYFPYAPPEWLTICDIHSTLLYDSVRNYSVKYLGGWHDVERKLSFPEPLCSCLPQDPNVIYDTVYKTKPIEVDYAILERTFGTEVRTDTFICNWDPSLMYCQTEAYYDSEFHYDYYWSFVTKDFSGAQWRYQPIGENQDYMCLYLIDIIPFWESSPDSLKLVYTLEPMVIP